eukprot:5358027-Pyramimonas_sp.AAC.1
MRGIVFSSLHGSTSNATSHFVDPTSAANTPARSSPTRPLTLSEMAPVPRRSLAGVGAAE